MMRRVPVQEGPGLALAVARVTFSFSDLVDTWYHYLGGDVEQSFDDLPWKFGEDEFILNESVFLEWVGQNYLLK